MTKPLLATIALLLVVLCFSDARLGWVISLVAGLAQDPLRKLVPGQPVYLTALATGLAAVTVVGMWLQDRRISFRQVSAWNSSLRAPTFLFLVLVLLQSAVTLARSRSPVLAAIGVLAYMAPVPGFLIGYHLTRSDQDLRAALKAYILITVVMLSGVYLSLAGISWPILKPVGVGLYAYAPNGGVLDLYCGLFRGSELAGWHGATAAAMLLMLFVSSRRRRSATVAVALLLLILVAVLLTGRRKFLVEFGTFAALYTAAITLARRRNARLGALALAGGVVAIGAALLGAAQLANLVEPYYVRGIAVRNEAAGRFSGLALNALKYVVARNGFFGAGAGMGSQGSQYFGGGAGVVGSAAEGGIGKVLAELGVPGVLLLGWFLVGLIRYAAAVVRDAQRREPTRALLALGLFSFLLANVTVFTIASQIFGDPYVLLLLGWLTGVLLAVPRLTIAPASGIPRPAAVVEVLPSPRQAAMANNYVRAPGV